MSNLEDKIKQIENDLAYEKSMYQTACEYPTDTAQFYSALERQRVSIERKEQHLEELRKESKK